MMVLVEFGALFGRVLGHLDVPITSGVGLAIWVRLVFRINPVVRMSRLGRSLGSLG